MADGLNEARALRVTELLRDYQSIQIRIATCSATPSPGEQNESGHKALWQCQNEARALLGEPYPPEMLHPPTEADETAKRQLQRVILDASARRFRAQRICLRATAAIKWIHAHNTLLKGQKPKNGDKSKLAAIEDSMRQELDNITDQSLFDTFEAKDQQAGFWLADDPTLSALQAWIRAYD